MISMSIINKSWDKILEKEYKKEYFNRLMESLNQEYEIHNVYPPKNEIFKSLELVPYENIRAVILGQDPYHGKGQANGLAFSVNKGIKIPPSLNNIYKLINKDLGLYIPNHGDLTKWANEGVLLLNRSLTVRGKQADSHRGLGWEEFTGKIIEIVGKSTQPIVFFLWGKKAQEAEKYIDTNKHLVLTSVHPSPLSAYRGFFDSEHFKKANEFIKSKNLKEIDWQIENI